MRVCNEVSFYGVGHRFTLEKWENVNMCSFRYLQVGET